MFEFIRSLVFLVFRSCAENLNKCLSYKSISANSGDFRNEHFLRFFGVFWHFLRFIWKNS